MPRWLNLAVPFAILIGALFLRIADPGPVQQLRLIVFDTYQRLNPRIHDPKLSPVRVIDIDDESLKRLGQWPWPRTQMAKLIDRLNGMGAAAIGLDIIFAEPDRTSPENLLPLWPESAVGPELRTALKSLPKHDEVLAKSFAKARVVTAFAMTGGKGTGTPVRRAGFSFAGDNPLLFAPKFNGAVTTLPKLEKVAKGNGAVNWIPDRDNVVRQVPLVLALDGKLYPSMLAEMLRVAQGASGYIVRSSGASGEVSFGEQTGITAVKIGNFVVPTGASGEVTVRYSHRRASLTVPAWKILEPGFDASKINGFLVFIGTSAVGLNDLKATPLGPGTPGVEVHTQVIEQILSNTYLTRPDWAPGAELVFLVIFGLFLVWISHWRNALWGAIAGGFAVVGSVWASYAAFKGAGLLFDPIFPLITASVVYLADTLIAVIRTDLERRQVRNAFSRYMSPELVRQLAENPKQLVLGGQTREMSILFSDIRGFTSIAEKMDAAGVTRFINRYLTPMTDIILDERGTIDKYMGDAIMAFWNAPLDDNDHARQACAAALAMRARLKTLNDEWKAEAESEGKSFDPVAIGIGISTGSCNVGNMGSEQRFDYSVLGDDVNLASRLEGQCKTYGTDIIIAEATRAAAEEAAAIEIDMIRVKGKERPERIFALIGGKETADSASFKTLAEANARLIGAYRAQKWKAAKAALDDARAADTDWICAGTWQLYRERIADYEADPPPAGWDGVFEAKTK